MHDDVVWQQLGQILCGPQIWETTKGLSPAPGEGLTREQFSVALRLIAAAQVMQGHAECYGTSACLLACRLAQLAP